MLLALLVTAAAAVVWRPAERPAALVLERFFVPAAGYSVEVTVLNHGVGATREARRLESPALLLQSAAAFAARGYAVVMPLRRGFGSTGGVLAESPGSCRAPDAVEDFLRRHRIDFEAPKQRT